MCVRPKFVALLPNAVVVFAPVFANMFADAVQHSMHVAVQFFGFTKEMRHGLDKLAINIQLHLFACGVAHAHRQRLTVSVQLRHQSIARFNFSSMALPSGGTTAGASAEKLNVKATDSPDFNTKRAAKPSGVGSSPISPRRIKTLAPVSIRQPNFPASLIFGATRP